MFTFEQYIHYIFSSPPDNSSVMLEKIFLEVEGKAT